MNELIVLNTHLSKLFKELRNSDRVKNQTDFGVKIGVSRAFVSQMFSGTSPVPNDILNKVNSAFGEEWGNRLREIIKNKTFESNARIVGDPSREKYYLGKHSVYREINDDGDYTIICPYLSIKARAGYYAGWGDDDYIETMLPKMEFHVNETHRGEYLIIEAEGDSMKDGTEDGISDGDIMLVRKLKREAWAQYKLHLNDDNPDFVIHHFNDGIVVKRVIEHNLEDGYILCRSLNPDKINYPDFKVPINEISQMFTVVQVTKKRKRKIRK